MTNFGEQPRAGTLNESGLMKSVESSATNAVKTLADMCEGAMENRVSVAIAGLNEMLGLDL